MGKSDPYPVHKAFECVLFYVGNFDDDLSYEVMNELPKCQSRDEISSWEFKRFLDEGGRDTKRVR